MTSKLLKKVLVAPLDWGLGHASRCIPLISALKKRGCNVVIAASGAQLALLQQEFPGIAHIELKGYEVSYAKHKRFFTAKILWQIPKILLRIRQEHQSLDKIIAQEQIDLVIADNRYGLYSSEVPCIYITHQLTVKAGSVWAERQMQRINYRFIRKFAQCWVPDFEGKNNIAGVLSHPQKMPQIPTKYIGPLSRFENRPSQDLVYKYLFMISGPEPQRSILQQLVFTILPKLQGKIMVVLGLPGETQGHPAAENITIKNHLDTDALERVFLQSEFVISRSGYTTVMELLALQKKAILIPTPGQTEQEYLALRLMLQQWCYTCDQQDDLLQHINKATTFDYQLPELGEPVYEKVIDDFLNQAFGV